jgi:hypothetical protein
MEVDYVNILVLIQTKASKSRSTFELFSIPTQPTSCSSFSIMLVPLREIGKKAGLLKHLHGNKIRLLCVHSETKCAKRGAGLDLKKGLIFC